MRLHPKREKKRPASGENPQQAVFKKFQAKTSKRIGHAAPVAGCARWGLGNGTQGGGSGWRCEGECPLGGGLCALGVELLHLSGCCGARAATGWGLAAVFTAAVAPEGACGRLLGGGGQGGLVIRAAIFAGRVPRLGRGWRLRFRRRLSRVGSCLGIWGGGSGAACSVFLLGAGLSGLGCGL